MENPSYGIRMADGAQEVQQGQQAQQNINWQFMKIPPLEIPLWRQSEIFFGEPPIEIGKVWIEKSLSL